VERVGSGKGCGYVLCEENTFYVRVPKRAGLRGAGRSSLSFDPIMVTFDTNRSLLTK
jgi:hypothetical protein